MPAAPLRRRFGSKYLADDESAEVTVRRLVNRIVEQIVLTGKLAGRPPFRGCGLRMIA